MRLAWPGIVVLCLGSMTGGCSILQKEAGEQLPAGAFRGTAALKSQTVPLPVEIATDIARITEEGKVEKRTPQTASQNVAEAKPTDDVSSPAMTPEAAPPKAAAEAKAKVNPVPQEVVETTITKSHPLSGRQKFSRRVSGAGKSQNYKVRPGDTLMKISYAKYGSIFRWREIFEANRTLLKDFNKLEIGSVLVIHGVEFVVFEKNGEPYLIRRGDTLRTISQKLYGSPDQWRALWKNNQRLIANPNRIYAGFILYYPASQTTPAVQAPRQATDLPE